MSTEEVDYTNNNKELLHNEEKKRKLIGIDGNWYDITNFIKHHPGGDVIEKFIGKDATEVFHAFHKGSVLKHRKPYRKMEPEETCEDPVGKSFENLRLKFEREGYFDINYRWYTAKFVTSFIPLAICVYLVTKGQTSYVRYLGAIFLAAFWQQCGFFMHDFEHNHFTGDRRIDRKLGMLFGTFFFGISGAWWREEHFIHHALTTTVDMDSQFIDPQMKEPIWAQNEKLWPFYKSQLEYYLIKIQHITFIPICIGVGRIGIMIDSMKEERRVLELIAFALHWAWVGCILSYLPTWREVIIFYGIAAVCQGILHVQLLISHYAKDFHDLKDISTTVNWYRMQVESNIDITNPWWMDWFHGGLNFHLVHHLYPRMPRHNYRQATEYIKRVCKENNLIYDNCSWFSAVYRTLKHLKLMSHHFKLDPR